jgi:hypothetical protein
VTPLRLCWAVEVRLSRADADTAIAVLFSVTQLVLRPGVGQTRVVLCVQNLTAELRCPVVGGEDSVVMRLMSHVAGHLTSTIRQEGLI